MSKSLAFKSPITRWIISISLFLIISVILKPAGSFLFEWGLGKIHNLSILNTLKEGWSFSIIVFLLFILASQIFNYIFNISPKPIILIGIWSTIYALMYIIPALNGFYGFSLVDISDYLSAILFVGAMLLGLRLKK